MKHRAIIAAALANLSLAACDPAPDEAEMESAQAPGDPTPDLPAPPEPPTAEELALLDAEDCRTVAEGYIDAIERRDFQFAAEFWDDPVVDGARLAALFGEYGRPEISIANVMEEGTAGTLHCTVTGALADAADDSRALREGQFELSRVNNIPGATAEQLRWHVMNSTFIEPMERVGRGEPA